MDDGRGKQRGGDVGGIVKVFLLDQNYTCCVYGGNHIFEIYPWLFGFGRAVNFPIYQLVRNSGRLDICTFLHGIRTHGKTCIDLPFHEFAFGK